VAHLCVSLGWSWEETEDLTMPQLRALRDYFDDHPPLHLVVAAALNVKSRRRAQEREASRATIAALDALLAQSAAGGGRVR